METNNIVTDDQHGFMKKRSCLTNLIMNLEEITGMVDNGDMVDQIYLDLCKAFDKVPHQRLLYKLQQYGISGTLLTWVESFLSHRQQRVKVNNSFSNWTDVTSGVPQGSVLGPVLFILYINDLNDNLSHCSCKIFADDTKLTHTANNESDALMIQKDLNNLDDWCKEWKMYFNDSKCHVLHFGKRNWGHYYHLGGCLITPSSEEKDLGVIISNDLKVAKNVAYSVKKANKVIAMIKRTFSYLDKAMLVQLFKVYVRPHLEYCQQACAPYMIKDIDMIESAQKRAIKLIKSLESMTYEDRLKELKLYSLKDRRIRGDLIFMHRIMTGDINVQWRKLFTLKNYTRTRGHHMMVQRNKLCRLDSRNNFFTERVIGPWNSLPEHIVSSKSTTEFKNKYDKWRGLVA